MSVATLQIGEKIVVINVEFLPAVGTVIEGLKQFSKDGNSYRLRVTDHEWSLQDGEGDIDENYPQLTVRIKTVYLE